MSLRLRPVNTMPDKSHFGKNGLIELGIDTARDRIDFWTSSGGSISAISQLPPYKWSHIAAVGSGSALKIYINGIETAVGGSSTVNYGTNASVFKIGEGVLAPSGDFFEGRVDDVGVYSRALCPEEILDLYLGGRPSGVRIIRCPETR